MKFSEFIKLVKPEYKFLKLIPNNSIRNNSTYKIARAIASLYKNLLQMIEVDNRRLVKLIGKNTVIPFGYKFKLPEKVSYYVYMEKTKIEFYFIVPENYLNLFKERIRDSWNEVTVKIVDNIPVINDGKMSYLKYEKEDALSLNIDLRSNELLNSNLNVVDVMGSGDKIAIFYNFIPLNNHYWRSYHKGIVDKVLNNEPVDKDKTSMLFLLKYLSNLFNLLVNTLIESIFDNNKTSNNINKGFMLDSPKIGKYSIRKENDIILGTQIVTISKSKDKVREYSNLKSVNQSFESVSGDNRLIQKNLRKSKLNVLSIKINGVQINKMSDKECQNFISLAGRDILENYNFIEKVGTKETKVPDELQKGIMCIGENVFRGNKTKAYLSNDSEYRNLSLVIIGPTRAGKSTLIGNLANDAINNNECVVIFDFIKNCELSDEVAGLFDNNKVLNIECDDFNKIQGLGYNEVGKEEDPFKQYDNAKKQTTQLMTLVNSINSDDTSFTAKMERYLTSASLVVFISNGSIADVFNVLQNNEVREKFIRKVPSTQLENLNEYINSLRELNDTNKNGDIIGTKTNLIVGIIDRLNKLKANTYMELMLKKDTKGNIDLSKEIQKNQLICIRMPEDMFSTDAERDAYTTYWTTKLLLSLQVRAKRIKDRSKHTKVNFIVDELYQVNNTEKLITSKISRLAKFSLKPIISCHYINQLKYLRNELRSANASYMLISGVDKNNYNEFKEELYPYEIDDVLKLPRYNSLNLIKYKDGYAKFITKLPKPIK